MRPAKQKQKIWERRSWMKRRLWKRKSLLRKSEVRFLSSWLFVMNLAAVRNGRSQGSTRWIWKEAGNQVIRASCMCPRDCTSLSCLIRRVPYAALAKAFSLIEATTKRIEKTTLLTSLLLLIIRRRAESDTESLLQAVYLCINRVSSSPIIPSQN